MAISTVQIANFALSKIGTDSTIESLTENSAEAKACNLWWEHTRKQTLAAFNWTFAEVRATLAAHGDDPSDDWAYRYVYPVDCVKARFIFNPVGRKADPVEYKIEQSTNGTKSILTDEASAILLYTADVTVPSLYTEFFIETLATVLGSHIAFPLTRKINLARLLAGEAQQMFKVAPAMDAVEGQDSAPRNADHTRARE